MNISETFIRTAMLFGEDAEEKLKNSSVIVFGVGGVGGHCVEALARSGVGTIYITDNDTVAPSNLNRQCAATKSSMGMLKVDAMKQRVEDVSDAAVFTSTTFVLPQNIETAVPQDIDFIVDAQDTVSTKIALAEFACKYNIPIIASMGMGNRTDPTQVRRGDIFSVTGCPLARTMRRELKKRNITSLPVVYSLQLPKEPLIKIESNKRSTPASCAFVPAAAGLAMAAYVVEKLLNK